MNTFTYQLVKVLFPGFIREVEDRIYEYEAAIEEWIDYTEQLKDQIRQYTPTIVDYKIAKKIVPTVKLGKVNQDTSKGRKVERNSYAMVLPGMPAINEDYDPVMDADGIISFEKRVIVAPVNPPKSEDSKVDNGNGNKPNKDQGSFEAGKGVDWIVIRNQMTDKDKLNRKLDQTEQEWLKTTVEKWNKNGKTEADMVQWTINHFSKKNGKK